MCERWVVIANTRKIIVFWLDQREAGRSFRATPTTPITFSLGSGCKSERFEGVGGESPDIMFPRSCFFSRRRGAPERRSILYIAEGRRGRSGGGHPWVRPVNSALVTQPITSTLSFSLSQQAISLFSHALSMCVNFLFLV